MLEEYEYVCLDDTSLSVEAEKDIDAYEEFYYNMEAYVALNLLEEERLTRPQHPSFYQKLLLPWIEISLPERIKNLPKSDQFVSTYTLFLAVLGRLQEEGIIKLHPLGESK